MLRKLVRRGAVAVALVLTVGACARVESCRKTAATTDAGVDAGSRPAAWSVVAQGIGDDGAWSDDALTKAFAMTFAPIPGVEVPPADESVPFCRGSVVRMMEERADKLPPAQRDAVKKALSEEAPPPPTQNAIAFADTTAAQLRTEVERANAWVARFLGRPEVDVRIASTRVIPTTGRGTIYADAHPICPRVANANLERRADWRDATTREDTRTCACQLRIARAGRELPSRGQLFEVLVHELTHCHQYRHQDHGMGGDWLAEGHAMWVQSRAYAESGAPTTESLLRGSAWGPYLAGDDAGAAPGRLLLEVTLHAGAFALVQALFNEGYEVKTGLLGMMSTPAGPAFDQLAVAKPAAFAAWASQSINEPHLGQPWVPAGPAMWESWHRVAKSLPSVSRGQSRTVTAARLGQQVSYVPIGTGDVVEISTAGFGRALFGTLLAGDGRIGEGPGGGGVGAEVGWQRPDSFLYCLKPEGCNVGFPLPLARVRAGLLVAVTGRGSAGASVAVTPYSEDDIRNRVNCIYGRWKFDDSGAAAAIGARLTSGTRVVSVHVDDVLDIRRDGSFREEVRSASVELETPGAPMRSAASGARSGRIAVQGNRLVTTGVTDDLRVTASIRIGNTWTPAPMDRAQAIGVGLGEARLVGRFHQMDVVVDRGDMVARAVLVLHQQADRQPGVGAADLEVDRAMLFEDARGVHPHALHVFAQVRAVLALGPLGRRIAQFGGVDMQPGDLVVPVEAGLEQHAVRHIGCQRRIQH